MLGLLGKAYESLWSFSWPMKDTKMQKGVRGRGHWVRSTVGTEMKRCEVPGEQGVPWRLVGKGGRGSFRPCGVGPSISFFPSYFMHIHMYMNSGRCDKPSRHFSERFLLDILNI